MTVTYLIRIKRGRLRPETKHHGKSRIHLVLVTDMELTPTINFYRATMSFPEQIHRLLICACLVGSFSLKPNFD